jgi:DNA polymerase III delta prime subunit
MKIKSVKSLGINPVYDVVTSGKNKNFVLANGVVAHNCNSVQPALRNLMEDYSESVRFILTCNYPNKIMPALHSRCQGFHIDKTDTVEFTTRVATVLVQESIDFDLDTLDTFVKATYPDLRKCLNLLQSNSTTGTLTQPKENDQSMKDWRLDAVSLFKAGEVNEARKIICNQASAENMEGMFTWMYNNLALWSNTPEGQDKAIIIIRKGIINSNLVADPEINVSATLAELKQLCDT